MSEERMAVMDTSTDGEPIDLETARGRALERLGGSGLLSLVWLDERLVTVASFGAAGKWVRTGVAIGQAIPVFVGLEDELRALRDGDDGLLVLANVGIGEFAGSSSSRATFEVLWQAPHYLVAVHAVEAQSDLEFELARQVRARRLAEAGLRRAEAELVRNARVIAETNRELRSANEDLENFAHIISHDLKAPLRVLRLTAERISAEVRTDEPEFGPDHLERLLSQAERMDRMLDALFEYSQIGRKSELARRTDLGQLVREIAAGLGLEPGVDAGDGEPNRSGFKVRIEGDWPTLEVVVAPLDLVLRNLISNAVKHHDRAGGIIRLDARIADDKVVINITDDGPGIPPDHHDFVFRPFTRLDPEATEGAGIGLALAKKAVELSGGKLRLFGNHPPDRGTTVELAWPLRPVGAK